MLQYGPSEETFTASAKPQGQTRPGPRTQLQFDLKNRKSAIVRRFGLARLVKRNKAQNLVIRAIVKRSHKPEWMPIFALNLNDDAKLRDVVFLKI